MFALIFAIPFVAALLCMGLNQLVPTRWLGLGAAVALLITLGVLWAAELPLTLPVRSWNTSDEQSLDLVLTFNAANRPFMLLTLGGGALALTALALALPRDIKGFGGLFAPILLLQMTVIAGLANQTPLLLPVAWALISLLGFLALQASGSFGTTNAFPVNVLAGFAGSLLLVGATLTLANPDLLYVSLTCWTLVGLLALGMPPFHSVFDEPAQAPSALVGALLPLGLPLLAGYALLYFPATQWSLIAPGWRNAWLLLGLLAWLACSAGALRETRIRRMINWQFSAQIGLVFIALGISADPSIALASGLLVNAAVSTLVFYLAMAVIERRAGTDDINAIGAHGPFLIPGISSILAGASAIGFPGTWGWWVYSHLYEQIAATVPWLIAPLLVGMSLRILAYLPPFASFWRYAPTAEGVTSRWPRILAALCPLIAVLLLIVWGFVPNWAWQAWQTPSHPASQMPIPSLAGQVGGAVALISLIGLPWMMMRGYNRTPSVEQADIQNPGIQFSQALGDSLRGLSFLATPNIVFTTVWDALQWLSRMIAKAFSLLEERYYLAGLIISVLIIILVML